MTWSRYSEGLGGRVATLHDRVHSGAYRATPSRRVIHLIIKWLNAGVMEEGVWRDNLQGTLQGAVISPLLANVFRHYVLDLWFHKQWRHHAGRSAAAIKMRNSSPFWSNEA